LSPREFQLEAEKFTQQIECWSAIIDSMTQLEREDPSVILGSSRIEHIAHCSGATVEQVEWFVNFCISYSLSVRVLVDVLDGRLEPHKEIPFRFNIELCEKTHANIMAGTCPWCGREISGWEKSGGNR